MYNPQEQDKEKSKPRRAGMIAGAVLAIAAGCAAAYYALRDSHPTHYVSNGIFEQLLKDDSSVFRLNVYDKTETTQTIGKHAEELSNIFDQERDALIKKYAQRLIDITKDLENRRGKADKIEISDHISGYHDKPRISTTIRVLDGNLVYSVDAPAEVIYPVDNRKVTRFCVAELRNGKEEPIVDIRNCINTDINKLVDRVKEVGVTVFCQLKRPYLTDILSDPKCCGSWALSRGYIPYTSESLLPERVARFVNFMPLSTEWSVTTNTLTYSKDTPNPSSPSSHSTWTVYDAGNDGLADQMRVNRTEKIGKTIVSFFRTWRGKAAAITAMGAIRRIKEHLGKNNE